MSFLNNPYIQFILKIPYIKQICIALSILIGLTILTTRTDASKYLVKYVRYIVSKEVEDNNRMLESEKQSYQVKSDVLEKEYDALVEEKKQTEKETNDLKIKKQKLEQEITILKQIKYKPIPKTNKELSNEFNSMGYPTHVINIP